MNIPPVAYPHNARHGNDAPPRRCADPALVRAEALCQDILSACERDDIEAARAKCDAVFEIEADVFPVVARAMVFYSDSNLRMRVMDCVMFDMHQQVRPRVGGRFGSDGIGGWFMYALATYLEGGKWERYLQVLRAFRWSEYTYIPLRFRDMLHRQFARICATAELVPVLESALNVVDDETLENFTMSEHAMLESCEEALISMIAMSVRRKVTYRLHVAELIKNENLRKANSNEPRVSCRLMRALLDAAQSNRRVNWLDFGNLISFACEGKNPRAFEMAFERLQRNALYTDHFVGSNLEHEVFACRYSVIPYLKALFPLKFMSEISRDSSVAFSGDYYEFKVIEEEMVDFWSSNVDNESMTTPVRRLYFWFYRIATFVGCCRATLMSLRGVLETRLTVLFKICAESWKLLSAATAMHKAYKEAAWSEGAHWQHSWGSGRLLQTSFEKAGPEMFSPDETFQFTYAMMAAFKMTQSLVEVRDPMLKLLTEHAGTQEIARIATLAILYPVACSADFVIKVPFIEAQRN